MRVALALGVDPATVIDLSASLNPVAPDVAALAIRHLDALGRYPDDGPGTALLAAALGVDAGRLVLTNGGAEAIALTATVLGRGEVIDPEFSLYRRHLPVTEAGAGRWRSNPSNPTGTLAGPDERAAVWDEAFFPLATGRWTGETGGSASGPSPGSGPGDGPRPGHGHGDGDDPRPGHGDGDGGGVWRLGSLTKLWACPGLRLGYVLAPDPGSAAKVEALRPRWAVNGLALALLPDLLDRTDLAGWVGALADLRADLAGGLGDLGFAVTPTAANWVLVTSTLPLRDLLARHGVVIRDCTGFGLPDRYRVALPRRTELDRVLAAFAAVAAAVDGDPR